MLRIVVLPLLIFLFSMACMGQTFQYSRGWTNGKRNGGIIGSGSGSLPAGSLTNLFRKDDDGLAEIFDMREANERRLERCLVQLQHVVRNPLLLHTAAAALAMNPMSSLSSANQNGGNSNNNNNINNNNPFVRSHQSNELFEELNSSVIDANDYGKH